MRLTHLPFAFAAFTGYPPLSAYGMVYRRVGCIMLKLTIRCLSLLFLLHFSDLFSCAAFCSLLAVVCLTCSPFPQRAPLFIPRKLSAAHSLLTRRNVRPAAHPIRVVLSFVAAHVGRSTPSSSASISSRRCSILSIAFPVSRIISVLLVFAPPPSHALLP